MQGENKINFAAFVTALHHIAEEKDVEPWEGVLRVVASKMGPDPGGIVPDAVSLYDDKVIFFNIVPRARKMMTGTMDGFRPPWMLTGQVLWSPRRYESKHQPCVSSGAPNRLWLGGR